jgi:hypothetical protein
MEQFSVCYFIKLNDFFIAKKMSSYALSTHYRTVEKQAGLTYAPCFWTNDTKKAKVWSSLSGVKRFACMFKKEYAPYQGYTVCGTDGSVFPLDDLVSGCVKP